MVVHGMVKRYRPRGWRRRRAAPVAALDEVDLVVDMGEVVGIMGESGAGKTTLVRAALGLVPFDEGECLLLGHDIATLDATRMRRLRRQAQLLFQNPASMLNPGLTVRQHLTESARLHRPGEPAEVVVGTIARRLGLTHRLDARPSQLSGGEMRRVGLGRVMVAEPMLVVADEPTAGLDAALKAELIDLLLEELGPARACVLVSHDIRLLAYAAHRLVVMLAGRVVERFPVGRLGSLHHPYTTLLLRAAGFPVSTDEPTIPHALRRHGLACPHAASCPIATSRCRERRPAFVTVAPGHSVACHHLDRVTT